VLYIALMNDPDGINEPDEYVYDDDSFDPAEEARWAWEAAHHGEFDFEK